MVKVRFLRPDGSEEACDVAAGLTVMEAALNNGVDEIIADCGGALSCATCHVYVDEAWMGRAGAPSEAEEEMLEFALDRRPTSRLSCQIKLVEGLDGLSITLPERQQ
ncbi:2Fe-2S iron-sulfur cluster-binding protein [Rhizorhabdus dicambivorans]|uniref:Ferredoxin n=1 Tax=Rhizorhabdus dicambivorans TaxID=1850238 RepID=A0A2A4FYJ4_9SPHN|nr:ferredoxin [Rhizorhabdus dicambivorans]PCE42777.1 ferredoxin [Rhizorhabdus dicambivorans]